ncbi:MAG TPA: glycosyl transferase [Leeuwenhoekiella sp.]|nr:glycosyl transferase [Leeuwenhoekiella sp.]HBO28528.1 glycosyl transferase [Leeuwenhoekiella sp.]HCQ78087.1 glycosyl transferase [Leeuwenhoekiella sp.]|tara:strand:+ start:298 stop:1212 length:915 start_codon:yes stop_codon:yes gene_type:complete
MPLLDSQYVSILITTYNRKKELIFTLNTLRDVISPDGIYIWDDASTDGTFEYISKEYPEINIFQNKENKGLISNRNHLMQAVTTEYVISLDDDAHFLNPEALEKAMLFMQENLNCAVLSFRLFWGLEKPASQKTTEKTYQVSNFLGGAHLMRKSAWDNFITSYPEWYHFYGEEDYAAMKLFRAEQMLFYFPKVLVHHRVSLKNRKKGAEETSLRTQWALQAAWSNYLIFYPKQKAWFKIMYSIKEQIRLKFLKGDFSILRSLGSAGKALIKYRHYRKRLNLRFSNKELQAYLSLPQAPVFWRPE